MTPKQQFLLSFFAAALATAGCGSSAAPDMPSSVNKESAQHIVVYSDAGFANRAEKTFVDSIVRRHRENPFDFGISAGDNIQSIALLWTKIEDAFEEPFRPLTQTGVRVYATLGNHDHMRSRAQDELAYSRKLNAEALGVGGFVMPDHDFVITKPNLKMVFLDVAESDNSVNWTPQRKAFAEREICNSKSTWLAVVFHYPMWSTGRHGDTKAMQDALLPILKNCPVDFVINGHDHHAELFRVNGIRYLIVGNSVQPRVEVKPSAQQSIFRMNDEGFSEITLTESQATLQFRDLSGAVRFEEKVTKANSH